VIRRETIVRFILYALDNGCNRVYLPDHTTSVFIKTNGSGLDVIDGLRTPESLCYSTRSWPKAKNKSPVVDFLPYLYTAMVLLQLISIKNGIIVKLNTACVSLKKEIKPTQQQLSLPIIIVHPIGTP